MTYEHLWAPWRLAFVKGELAEPAGRPATERLLPGAEPECFLCRAAVTDDARRDLVVGEGDGVVSLVNRFPYNNGHLLIAPRRHVGRFDALTGEEHVACTQAISLWIGELEAKMQAQGFNVGLNLGRTAGAGVPGHLHWHVVPRWSGDVNFMPTIAGAKVIPQALDDLWRLLTGAEE